MSNTRKTINPYTEEILEEYTLMSQQECENAIENAHNCFEE
jgi:succinate-semialdehyde dehydrogenase/glutarate-semialdehyde dehydrogenase